MIMLSHVDVNHDTDRSEYTVTLGWCEPAPGLVIEDQIEAKGETLSEALRNLSELVALTYEEAPEVIGV